MNVLDIDSLYVNYDETAVLWDISFSIPRGKLVGVIGPNGAGKSTLLKAILGLVSPLSGSIQTFGASIAYVPQRETVDWDFPITAFEVVLMGRYGKLGPLQRIRKADVEAARSALERVGMAGLAHRPIGALSGGQQQRLFLARAMVQEADLLLLDEPFAGVDLATEKAIVALLKMLCAEGKTVVVVHHDLPTVSEYFDWALLLNTRLIASGPVADVMRPEHLQSSYGKAAPLFEEIANLAAKARSGL